MVNLSLQHILPLQACFYECLEQGMRVHGAGFEFRMKLASKKPGVGRDFHNFHQIGIRADTAHNHTVLYERLAVLVVKFIAVAVALKDTLLAVGLKRKRPLFNVAGIFTEPHGAAQL